MALIIDGKPTELIPDGDKVHSNHDMWFKPGDPNTRKRVIKPEVLVLHWTGGEGEAERVYKTLRGRDLSVHATIDSDEIVQMADVLTTSCAHVGSRFDRPVSLNDRSVGAEVTCRGFASKADLQGSDLRDRTELDWSEPRDVYTDYIGGRKVRMAAFHPEQVDNVIWWCETLCGLLEIPRVVPWQEVASLDSELEERLSLDTGEGSYLLPVYDRQYNHKRGRRIEFQGVLGHFHVHENKCDPGTMLFRALWWEGFNPLGEKRPGWRS